MLLLGKRIYKPLITLVITFGLVNMVFAQSNDSIAIADTVSKFQIDSTTLLISDSIVLDTTPIRKVMVADTTIDSLRVTYFKGTLENQKLNNFNYIDTNTYNFQKFDPLYKHNRMYSTLSNIGHAAKNMVFSPTLTTGYFTKAQSFSHYMYHNNHVEYYQMVVPYTELNYVMSSNREQNFNVVFTRNLFKGFSIGLDYALNFSPTNNSPYVNSGANDQRFYFTGQYYTKNKRYGVIANYLHNNLKVEENGGIKYDSVFTENLETDRRVIAVNLESAENFLKQSGFFVEQYFNLLAPKPKNDSISRKIDPGNISYSFRYKRNRFQYSDDGIDSTFYFNHSELLDTVSTFDSLTQIVFENKIRWSNIGYHDNPDDKIFYIFAGGKHLYIQQVLPYDSVKSELTQYSFFGGVAFNFGRSFHLSGDFSYYFGNYNQGDFELNGNLMQYFGTRDRNIGFLLFDVNLISRAPNWYYNNYQSNYYSWNYNLDKENYLILSGSYNYKKLSAGVKFFTIGNYTYLNDSIRPAQLSKTETVMQFFTEGTIPLRKFGINTRIVYQTTSQPNFIRVPDFTGVIDLYFRSQIFKKAGTVQTGIQVTYFTEYYADAYMPALRLFHNQNEKVIGNYPYLDVYVTLMVKRARMFVSYSHFNSHFGNYNYFLAPNYPARDARLAFGVSWRFHD